MNVHKFCVKPRISQPETICWLPLQGVKHPPRKVNPVTWEIFSQEKIIIEPREVKYILLGFGFMLTKGVVLTSLPYSLILKRCSLQNSIYILERVDDIIITITNNSKKNVTIEENKPLCLVYYTI